MKIRQILAFGLIVAVMWVPLNGSAGLFTSAATDAANFIFKKFGGGVGGRTAADIAITTDRIVATHGEQAIPLLKKAGHTGFTALESAGTKAPEVIKLFAKRGDESLWVISKPNRLAIFIKHGDTAAEAMIKHPGIADDIIERFGVDAASAFSKISVGSGQKLAIVTKDGLLSASARSPELLPVLRQYGDPAMEFIWKNKGALAVASVLGTFLADPQTYISGASELVIPISDRVNWTLIIVGVLTLVFLPFIGRRFVKTRKAFSGDQTV